jgi:hypothetical protein
MWPAKIRVFVRFRLQNSFRFSGIKSIDIGFLIDSLILNIPEQTNAGACMPK